MKIGFYVGSASMKWGGIAPYATRVVQELNAHTFPENLRVEILGKVDLPRESTSRLRMVELSASASRRDSLFARVFRRVREASHVLVGRGPLINRVPNRADSELHELVKTRKIDLVHFPYQVCPVASLPVPYVVTMHDVQHLHFPGYFTAEERRWRAIEYLRAIRESAAIVVSFDHVKNDIVSFFNCPPEKVTVVPLPYKHSRVLEPESPADTARLQEQYTNRGKYFLYPAQTWPHKNHLGLIDAFERVAQRVQEPISLVCTGGTDTPHFSTIKERIARSPFSRRIHFTGIVSEPELAWLYRNCVSVVIPSLYEAGSFPLIEAMQMNVPVLCGSTTSLPDTIGDSRFIFNPNSPDEIAVYMERMFVDDRYRAANIANCSKQIQVLNLQKTAAAYQALWNQLSQTCIGSKLPC